MVILMIRHSACAHFQSKHQNKMNRAILCLLSLVFNLFACQPAIELEAEQGALFLSDETQRRAHLENDAALLCNEIADSMLSLNRGEIQISSRQAIQERFQNYFSQVKYTSWDNTQAPIVHLSNDGQSASMYVQKLLDLQYRDTKGKLGEHQFALFAWNAEYQKVNQNWRIIANTSTEKSLSPEEALQVPIRQSTVYAVIDEADLIPEGTAYDPNTGTTFLSSTYKQKIVGIRPDGSYYDFKTEQEDGLWSTLGMEVDPERQILWVVSFHGNEVLPLKHPKQEQEWKSRIYAYRLPGGELINQYEPKVEGQLAFNDLCVDNQGGVYISESVQNKVYYFDPEDSSFEALPITDSLFVFPNGITLSEDDQYLYIASQGGLLQYKLDDGSYTYLKKGDGIIDIGIDGLAYYKGSLIANQSFRRRILQFVLDEKKGAIKSQRILEANNPHFDQPATGEIAGDTFIYLANAQMFSGFDKGRLRPSQELEKVILLQTPLTL